MHGAGNICSAWFLDIRIYKLVTVVLTELQMLLINPKKFLLSFVASPVFMALTIRVTR